MHGLMLFQHVAVFPSDLCSGRVLCVRTTCPPSSRLPLLPEGLGALQAAGFTAGAPLISHKHGNTGWKSAH